jgi:hypothetical protein
VIDAIDAWAREHLAVVDAADADEEPTAAVG